MKKKSIDFFHTSLNEIPIGETLKEKGRPICLSTSLLQAMYWIQRLLREPYWEYEFPVKVWIYKVEVNPYVFVHNYYGRWHTECSEEEFGTDKDGGQVMVAGKVRVHLPQFNGEVLIKNGGKATVVSVEKEFVFHKIPDWDFGLAYSFMYEYAEKIENKMQEDIKRFLKSKIFIAHSPICGLF